MGFESSRKDLRLEGYDYSSEGVYFITACTHHKTKLFGAIKEDRMDLNAAGEMMDFWIKQSSEQFPCVRLIQSVVMPNHIHLMIQLMKDENKVLPYVSLSTVMHWIKSMTTTVYIRGVKQEGYQPFEKKLWQRSYYDHIVRDQEDFERIWAYIDQNPLKWALDEYYNA